MISVIICSSNSKLLKNVKDNISRTIGVPCEILGYDNSINQKSICEIYNLGVRDAKFNILCFMHEDVEICTSDWGVEVLNVFEFNPRLGLLGVAGSNYKSLSPSGWCGSNQPEGINFINLLQRYKHSLKTEEVKYINKNSLPIAQVAVIDGVWFCGKKEILTKYKFDQNLLKKFHGYDIDISLLIGQYFDINVTFRVLITHFSEGTFNKDWVEQTLLLHEKWKNSLPVNINGLNHYEMQLCEKFAFKSFINTMRNSGYSSLSCIKVLNNSGVRKKFGWLLFTRLYIKCLSA